MFQICRYRKTTKKYSVLLILLVLKVCWIIILTWVNVLANILGVNALMHKHRHRHTHRHTHIQTHKHTHTHTHTNTHIHNTHTNL